MLDLFMKPMICFFLKHLFLNNKHLKNVLFSEQHLSAVFSHHFVSWGGAVDGPAGKATSPNDARKIGQHRKTNKIIK